MRFFAARNRSAASLLLLVSSLPTGVVLGGLTYNGDLECGYPFTDLTIDEMECTPSSYFSFGDYDQADGYQGQQYNGQGGEEGYYYNQQPGSCLAGEMIDISGSVTIDREPIVKFFDITLKVCFTKWNLDFKCTYHKETIDLGYYSALEGAEEEAQQQYQQYWYNPYKNYDYDELYLEEGTYDYKVRLTIPDNKFTQVDTPARVYITFKPVIPYKRTYFEERAWWSRVKDYRDKTKCYGSFNGESEDQGGEKQEQAYNNNYYYQYQAAAVGVVSVVSIFAAYRRRQLAQREENPLSSDYEQHEEAPTGVVTP